MLDPRLQLGLVQLKIINRPDSHDEIPWEPSADSIHQRAALGAEVVLHRVACGDGVVLREFGELLAATDVLGGGLFDYEVACEHGGGDLAAVCAVTDERVDEVLAFSGLLDVSTGIDLRRDGQNLTKATWTAPQ